MVDEEGKLIDQLPAIGRSFTSLMREPEEKKVCENAKTYYQYCTAIPATTLLAQTWDIK